MDSLRFIWKKNGTKTSSVISLLEKGIKLNGFDLSRIQTKRWVFWQNLRNLKGIFCIYTYLYSLFLLLLEIILWENYVQTLYKSSCSKHLSLVDIHTWAYPCFLFSQTVKLITTGLDCEVLLKKNNNKKQKHG